MLKIVSSDEQKQDKGQITLKIVTAAGANDVRVRAAGRCRSFS